MSPLISTVVKAFFLGVFFALLSPQVHAQTKPVKPPAKSKFNTNIYEKSDEAAQFSDTVKVIRDMDSGTQVMFMRMSGFFTAPSDSTAMALIVESAKNKTPVEITIDEDSRKITKVRVSHTP